MLSFILSFLGSAIIWIVVELSCGQSSCLVRHHWDCVIFGDIHLDQSSDQRFLGSNPEGCSAEDRTSQEVEARDSDVPAERSVWEGIAGRWRKQADTIHEHCRCWMPSNPSESGFHCGRQADMMRDNCSIRLGIRSSAPFLEKACAVIH